MSEIVSTEKAEFVVKEWESVACPFCSNTKYKGHEKFGPDHRYTYVQCSFCDLVYLNPRPKYDEAFVEEAYSDYSNGSYYMNHEGKLSDQQRAVVESYKIILKKISPYLTAKKEGKLKLLEVGCADGMFLQAAHEMGFEVVGIDITASAVAAINKYLGLKAYCEQYQKLDLSADGPFDLIYCSHVIEHIPNVSEWMEKFKRDLAPKGILCINVPNQYAIDKFFKRMLKNIGLKKDKWALWRTPDHLYEPHTKPMKFLFAKHSYKLLDMYTYSQKEKVEETLYDKFYHRAFKLASKERYIATL